MELQGSRALCVCVKLPWMCTGGDAAPETLLGERNKISLEEAGETGWVAKPDLIRSDLLLCRVSAVLADLPHSWTRWATLEFALLVVGPVVGKGGSFLYSPLALNIFTCCVCL